MSLRKMLRFWLAWLAPVSRPLPVVLALPAPVADLPPALPSYRWLSLEALVRLPTVEPARAGYVRDAADCDTVTDLTKWMVYERSNGWWRTSGRKVRTAAVYWLGELCVRGRDIPAIRAAIADARRVVRAESTARFTAMRRGLEAPA